MLPIYAGSVGVWLHFASEYNTQTNYGKEEVCATCFARKGPGELCMADARLDAPLTRPRGRLEDYIVEQRELGTLHCFSNIPGWQVDSLRG